MRWARFLASLLFAGGLLGGPRAAAGQTDPTTTTTAAACAAPVGTLQVRSQRQGQIEGDGGPAIPIVGYRFEVSRVVEGDRQGEKRYAPLELRKPLDGATPALVRAFEDEDRLGPLVVNVNSADGALLMTYRFGIARIESRETATVDACRFEDLRLTVGVVNITHEPSGASVLDSGDVNLNTKRDEPPATP